jgi:hypothetical protein
VFEVVLRHGCANYFNIGLKMGFTGPEITSTTSQHALDKGKLQALIQAAVGHRGKSATAKKLIEVSKVVSDPFYGAIMEELEKTRK